MGVAKVTLNGTTLMDTTGMTVTSNTMVSAATALDKAGEVVTGTIATKTSNDITVNGSTVTVPAGVYNTAATKSVASAAAFAPAITLASSTGVVTGTNTFAAGYYSASTKTSTFNLTTQAAKTVTPTETTQTAVSSYRWTTGSVTVAGISSNYVGTNVPRKSSNDLTVSGSVVSGPIGYYSQAFSKAISAASGIGATISYLSVYNTIRATGVVSSAGYATAGDKGTYDIEPDSLLPVKLATTYTPTTANQTIASRQWLSGTQTILGDANLVASNIASGVSIFGVTGTHQGGDPMHTITLMNSGYSGGNEVGGIEYKNSNYFDQGTIINYTPGDTVRFFISGRYSQSMREIFLNNQLVDGLSARVYSNSYIYSLTSQPLYIYFDSNNWGIYAYEGNVNNLSIINSKLAKRLVLSATFEGVSTWADTLYYTEQYQFAQQPFNGNFTFNNLRYINSYTFSATSRVGYDGSFSATFPNISLISNNAFTNNYNIKYVNASNCLLIDQSAFGSCSYLTDVNFPNCTFVSYAAFASCRKLTNVVIPKVSSIMSYAFSGCWSLTSLVFSSVENIGNYAFQNCTSLQYISLPICQSIGTAAFSGCRQLISLYLNSVSTVTTLSASVFYSTPIGGYSASAGRYGSVFVPASLYNSFITATNWTAISSRIVSV